MQKRDRKRYSREFKLETVRRTQITGKSGARRRGVRCFIGGEEVGIEWDNVGEAIRDEPTRGSVCCKEG